MAGLGSTAKTRVDLLIAWKAREADSHWGSRAGHPPTDFRMTEGGADELGSMSYNQVQFHFRYSRKPYNVHKNANLNYFDPEDNLKGFIVHTAGKPTATGSGLSMSGSFYQAFSANSMAKGYGTSGPVGYKNCDDAGVCGAMKKLGIKEDNYELLAKAIAAYNLNPGGSAWPNILKDKPKGSCASCGYTIDVRNSKSKLGLPYRQYIWKGGKNPADMPILDANGSPELEADGVTQKVHPDAGKDWCFAYGESEWMEGKQWSNIKQNASPKSARGVWQTPVGQVDCN